LKFTTIPLDEITDSREVMEQRLPKTALIFIYVTAISLILLIIWSCIFEIETISSAESGLVSKKAIVAALEALGII
jgi:hypothetical protein